MIIDRPHYLLPEQGVKCVDDIKILPLRETISSEWNLTRAIASHPEAVLAVNQIGAHLGQAG